MPRRTVTPAGTAGGQKLPNGLPRVVYAEASPRSIGGTSLFEQAPVTAETVEAVQSERRIADDAAQRLRDAGFEVAWPGAHDATETAEPAPATFTIAGPPDLYERVFHRSLPARERPVGAGPGNARTSSFVECAQARIPGLIDTTDSDLTDVLEGVAIGTPRIHFAPTSLAPARRDEGRRRMGRHQRHLGRRSATRRRLRPASGDRSASDARPGPPTGPLHRPRHHHRPLCGVHRRMGGPQGPRPGDRHRTRRRPRRRCRRTPRLRREMSPVQGNRP